MEYITSAIMSGMLYDMIKNQVSLTADNIKSKLQGWLIDDSVAKSIEVELAKLQLSEDMSESAIEKKLDVSHDLLTLMKLIEPSRTTITQTHSGSGDNVAGNKIINK